MKKLFINTILFTIINIILYGLIFTSILVLEKDQKEKIADTITSLIREKFLIADYKNVTKDIEKSRNLNFKKILVFDKLNKLITESSTEKSNINLNVKKTIWIDSYQVHAKGFIVFVYSIDHLFYIAFKILLWSTLITLPLYFAILTFIRKRQDQLIQNEKTRVLAKLNKQISHDIRSPVMALQQLAYKTSNITGDELNILRNALERINEIANENLNESEKNFFEEPELINLKEVVEEIASEKKIALEKIIFDLELEDVKARFVSRDLKRILSNLINNSYEALNDKEKPILITLRKMEQSVVLKIQDKGKGIPSKILEKIGKEEITTKKNGNGIGILHAVETLQKWDVLFNIVKSNSQGTTLELVFPLEGTSYVLIDNDELVRLTWNARAKKNIIDFKAYESFQAFNENKHLYSKNTAIYIDSDLGNDIKGEDIAKQLHEEGFLNISIASGFSSEKFQTLTFLRNIISKTPPF